MSMHSESEFGNIVREWMCNVQDAFAIMAKENRSSALVALAVATNAPIGINSHNMPHSPVSNYKDNHHFKRLTRAFAYLCVDNLYAGGVRCASTYTYMILCVTNVHITLPTAEVSNIVVTTALQRAMKVRMCAWTGTQPDYSTDMTTQQLYTFCCRYVDYLTERKGCEKAQSTLLKGVVEAIDAGDVEVWVCQIENMFPDIEVLGVGDTSHPLNLDLPAVNQKAMIEGQCEITMFMDDKGRLGKFSHKRHKPDDDTDNGEENGTCVIVLDPQDVCAE